MRPAPLDYVRADTLDEALETLAAAGPGAKALAGGQTLINQLRARALRPSTLVDISRLSELRYVHADDDELAVGALTPMVDLERQSRACRALAEAAARVGDPQVRARATAGGNLLNPEPISDLAPVLLASGGRLVVQGPDGRREVDAELFCTDAVGALRPAELIVELRFRRASARSAYEKLSRRAADPAMASAAAFVRLDGPRLSEVGLALGGVHSHPLRATAVEEELKGAQFDPGWASTLLAEFCAGLEPAPMPHADAEYRRQMAAVLAMRALSRCLDTAIGR